MLTEGRVVTVARQFLSAGAACLSAVVVAGCWHSAKPTYSEMDVTSVFSEHDIALVEKVRDDIPGEIGLTVLGADSPCETGDLSVNIFDDRDSLELYQHRLFGQVRNRYEFPGGVGLVKGNLLVVVRTSATCLQLQDVEQALDDLD